MYFRAHAATIKWLIPYSRSATNKAQRTDRRIVGIFASDLARRVYRRAILTRPTQVVRGLLLPRPYALRHCFT